MNIVDKIRKLQWERGWTDYKLAMEANISQSTLATIFARNTPPKFDILQCICDAFGISLAQFFLEDENIDFLSPDEKRVLTIFRKLSRKQQQALVELLEN